MTQVAIIGAGPYGLAAAAQLRSVGVETQVFGETMTFWDHQMPAGMLLRSYWTASHIGSRDGSLSLDAYQAASSPIPTPIPLERFVDYGRWFGQAVAPDVDDRRIERIERQDGGFRLLTQSGDAVRAQRVIVAAGIANFARRPREFDGIGRELASHSSEHSDLAPFEGKQVIVVGCGQSALESAALLHEAGAQVEVLARAGTIHWLRVGSGSKLHAVLHSPKNPLGPLMFPPSDVGPPGINLLVDRPPLFKAVPTRSLRGKIARRAIRPAGSGWLRARLQSVPINTGLLAVAAQPVGDRLRIRVSDGTTREVDHALLATGYAVDIAKYPFLSPELLRGISTIEGYPRLNAGFE